MKKINIVALISLFVVAVSSFFLYKNSDAVRIRKALQLGQKYLSELDYEEAVVSFNEVIAIDPMSVDAYLGLAEAYEGLGDMEEAIITLESGYRLTGDDRIEKRIEKLQKDKDNIKSDIVLSLYENNNMTKSKEIVDAIDLLAKKWWWPNYLTHTQRENVFRPFVESLENYLENAEKDVEAWEALAYAYLYLDEMEACLETRQKGYGITGDESLMPKEHTLVFANGYTRYDEFGRRLEAEYHDEEGEYIHTDTYIYEEGNRVSADMHVEEGYVLV